jgi:hypothetical protein
MGGLIDFFTGHLAASLYTGFIAGALAWTTAKPKPDTDNATFAIIGSIRAPLVYITGLLGAIFYLLSIPYR